MSLKQDLMEKARAEIQTMRDSGMTDAQIRNRINHQTVNSEIIMEFSRKGMKPTTARKLHKPHVTRKWLRRQLLAVPGNTPRFVDPLLDKIRTWSDDPEGCYAIYWQINRYAILAAQITERRRRLVRWILSDEPIV